MAPLFMQMEANIVVKIRIMYKEVLNHLPYKSSFRFVDNIIALDENGSVGEYSLKPGSFFTKTIFPVTPLHRV